MALQILHHEISQLGGQVKGNKLSKYRNARVHIVHWKTQQVIQG